MVATTAYLISPWVPLSVPGSSRALNAVEKLPQCVGWFIVRFLRCCRALYQVAVSVWFDVESRYMRGLDNIHLPLGYSQETPLCARC